MAASHFIGLGWDKRSDIPKENGRTFFCIIKTIFKLYHEKKYENSSSLIRKFSFSNFAICKILLCDMFFF